MIPCPQCNKQNPENFNYCLDCGAELHPETPHSAESQFFLDLSTDAEPGSPAERGAGALGGGLPSQSGMESPLELSPDDLLDDEEPLPAPAPASEPVVDTPVELEQPIMEVEVKEELDLPDEPLAPAAALPLREESLTNIPVPESDASDPLRPISSTETPEIPLPEENWMENEPEASPPAPAAMAAKEDPMPDIVRQVEDLEVDMTQIEERFCASCGAQLTQDARFCPRCGANSSETRSPHAGKTLFLNVPAEDAAPKSATVAHLTLLEANGSEGRRYPLHEGEQSLGREAADITLSDPSVSPLHAALAWRDGKMFVEDRGSLNGVYLKVKGEVPLPSKSFIRIGQQLLRYVALEDFEQDTDCVAKDDTRFMGSPVGSVWGKLLVITAQGRVRDALPLAKSQLLIGREQGELTFPQDGFVSGSHAKLSLRDGQVYLTDLGSSNGTYLRIEKQGLANNDLLLFGTKIMRFEYV